MLRPSKHLLYLMTAIQPDTHSPPAPMRAVRAFGGILRQLARNPLSLLGLMIVVVFVLLAIFGPAIAPYRYDAILPDAARHAPSPEYIFGADRLGRDVFSRVLWGARDIITLPLITSALAVFFGTCIGLFVGYYGGWIDEVVSWVMDSLLAIRL
ncbi:MAG: hypothetical protein LC121_05320 [Anaerolineae bacterium]|nr:hypothetical protein [Anaerolineae bacterium]